MVKSGRLINGVAQAYRLRESSVALAARFLREKGLLTTGANGVNAPDMTFLDAARVMLPYLVLDKPSLMADAVRVFGTFRLSFDPEREVFDSPRSFFSLREGIVVDLDDGIHIPDLDFLNSCGGNHSFEQAIAALLEQLSRPVNRPFYARLGVKVSVNAQESFCEISLPGWQEVWTYSGKQTSNMAIFASLFPDGMDVEIDSYRHTTQRDLSVANLVHELLSDYPAIQIQRSIDFDILVQVAALFSKEGADAD